MHSFLKIPIQWQTGHSLRRYINESLQPNSILTSSYGGDSGKKEHVVKHRDLDIQFDQRSQAIDEFSKVHGNRPGNTPF